MKEKLEKIVLRIDSLKECYKSNENKHRLTLGIAVFFLTPCAFVLKLNINPVVKITLTLFVALFMLEIILAISPFILLYHIWFRSDLKSIGKIVTTVFIVLFFVLCCVGAKQEINTDSIASYSDETKETILESEYTEKATAEEKETKATNTTTVTAENTTIESNDIIAKEAGYVQVLDREVFISEGEHNCIIGATKDNVNKLLKHFEKIEHYYIPYDEFTAYKTKYTNDNLMICVDYTENYIAKGVYVEAFDVLDPLTGEGSYVYEYYDEIINLVTGGQDVKIENDTEYANLSGLKKYPMALCIGELYE